MSGDESAVTLHASVLEPVAVEGCLYCAAFDRVRVTGRAIGSPVTVRLMNRRITEHPHRSTSEKGQQR